MLGDLRQSWFGTRKDAGIPRHPHPPGPEAATPRKDKACALGLGSGRRRGLVVQEHRTHPQREGFSPASTPSEIIVPIFVMETQGAEWSQPCSGRLLPPGV